MKKSSKLFSAILAVMLMVSALGAIPANAVEAEVTVNSLPELEEAIAAAVNGDMIYIAKDIDIQEEVSLGSVDKTVFLAGAEGTSVVLSISPDFPDGQSVSFANLVCNLWRSEQRPFICPERGHLLFPDSEISTPE